MKSVARANRFSDDPKTVSDIEGRLRQRKEKGAGVSIVKLVGGLVGIGCLLVGASYWMTRALVAPGMAKPMSWEPHQSIMTHDRQLSVPALAAKPKQGLRFPTSALDVVRTPSLAAQALRNQRLEAVTMQEGTRAIGDIATITLKVPDVPVVPSDRLVLFSMFTNDGKIPADTRYLIEKLRSQRDGIYAVVATDAELHSVYFDPEFVSIFRGVVLRENHGLDFSAFAHILRFFPDLWEANQLTFTNDSNFGPLEPESFTYLYARIDRSTSSFIGLTESVEGIEDTHHWHYQSFFTVLQNSGVQNAGVQEHWLQNIYSLSNKTEIIRNYELGLLPAMRDAGLQCEAMFSLFDIDGGVTNPSIVRPDALIERGYPLLKKQLFKVAQLRPYLDQVNLQALNPKYPFDLQDIKVRGGYEPQPLFS